MIFTGIRYMGGKASRDKGAAYEREIVNWHRERGVDAERVPLSGAMKGNYASDIKLGPSLGLIAECKRMHLPYRAGPRRRRLHNRASPWDHGRG